MTRHVTEPGNHSVGIHGYHQAPTFVNFCQLLLFLSDIYVLEVVSRKYRSPIHLPGLSFKYHTTNLNSNSPVSRRQKFPSPTMDFAPSDAVATINLPPHSYLFFVVAKVGPGESHRPVAVALRQGDLGEQFGIRGHQVIRYCIQTIDVLSDPGNRIAIRAELDLAAAFYKNDTEERLLPRIKLPELNRWASSPELDSKQIRRRDRGLSQFPP